MKSTTVSIPADRGYVIRNGTGKAVRMIGAMQDVTERKRAEHPAAGLVLLDLNMPRLSGIEVLKQIRKAPATASLPVVVVTSSMQDSDIHRAYLHGANGYVVKPSRPEQLLPIVKSIKDFWLTHNCVVHGFAKVPPEQHADFTRAR